MSVMETIAKRQSCRAYTNDQITENELTVILNAANAAPVGMGKFEDVKLTVIQNSSLVTKIDETAAAMFNKAELSHPTYGAQTLILVSCLKTEAPISTIPYCNASCIMENMMLAATELNLGSVFLMGVAAAISMNNELCKELKVPEGFIPVAALAVGKPVEELKIRELTVTKIATDFIK